MKKTLLFLLTLLCITTTNAEDVGDLRYSLGTSPRNYATVKSYIGSGTTCVIPEIITYNSKTYPVTGIEDNAFCYCAGLTSITIPNSVTSIGTNAFYECKSLSSIEIPESVTSIGYGIFSGCRGLTSISVNVGNSTYDSRDGCNAIIRTSTNTLVSACNKTTIPNSVTSIGIHAFAGCTGLTSITIPNSVTEIEYGAFSGCTGLKSINIPNSVTGIGNYAFSKCTELTSIEIPNSVIFIGSYAFQGCMKIQEITCRANPFTIDYNTFEPSCYNYATLYVMPDKVDSYKKTSYWNKFTIKALVYKYLLTYILEGNTYKKDSVNWGTSITPPIPIKEGYTFSGWSDIPAIMPNHDVTVTGSFAINKYRLTYVVNGKIYQEDSVMYGMRIVPPELTEESYTFSGWSEYPPTMPAHDVTISGTFSLNNGYYTIVSAGKGSGYYPYSNPGIIYNDEGKYALYNSQGLVSWKPYDESDCTEMIYEITYDGVGGYYVRNLVDNTYINRGTSSYSYACTISTSTRPITPQQIQLSSVSGKHTIKFKDNPYVYALTASHDGAQGVAGSTGDLNIWGTEAEAEKYGMNLWYIKKVNKINAYSVNIDQKNLTIDKFESKQLHVEIIPSEVDASLKWTSSNPSIVTVDSNGKITPLKNGQAIITATTIGNGNMPKDECVVTVAISSMFKVEKTQSTITVKCLNADAKSMTIVMNGETYTFADQTALFDGLTPNKLYPLSITADIDGNKWTEEFDVTTKDGTIAGEVTGTTQTTATLRLTANLGDATNVKKTVGGKEFDGEEVVLTDLTPNKDYTYTYKVQVGDDYSKSMNINFKTKDISISGMTTSTTQTTATLRLTASLGDATNVKRTLGGKKIESDQIVLTNLAPNKDYTYTYKVQVGTSYSKSVDVKFKTKDITVNFKSVSSPTTLDIVATYNVGDATFIRAGFGQEERSNKTSASGLNPGSYYTFTYYITTKEGGTKTYQPGFYTESLKFNTMETRVVSVGNVVISATSNITEDEDVNVGFEWRRYDWPSEITSSTGAAYIYDGMIEGSIKNLNADKFWKIRPFFKSAGGTMYYGDWVTIDPSNTSYFEPTVHTYAKTKVVGNTATVKGYALGGSDQVQEQGFRYWEAWLSSSSPKYPQATEVPSYAKTVTATGQLMTAELQNLQYEKEYRYVAFVTTADGKTYYGEEQSIKIEDPAGISVTTVETPASDDVKVYTLTGALIYSGASDKMQLEKGLYIVRHSDGKTQKIIIR